MDYAPPPPDDPGRSPSQQADPAPRYSPDRQWYWDGQRWLPAAAPVPPWSRPYAPPESRAAAAVALVVVYMAGAALFLVSQCLDLVASLVGPGSIIEAISLAFQFLASLGVGAGVVGTA